MIRRTPRSTPLYSSAASDVYKRQKWDLRQVYARWGRDVRVMTSQDRYGAAVHEAGHVVVAWVLGLKTRKMAVGIDGDDAKGAAEIEEGLHLPLVDQIAI